MIRMPYHVGAVPMESLGQGIMRLTFSPRIALILFIRGIPLTPIVI